MAGGPAIIADLTRHGTIFDLDQRNLGIELLDITAVAILVQMGKELDPDGNRWPELSEPYETWKSGAHPGALMSVLFALMKTLENLQGERLVTVHYASMTFGIEPEAKLEAEWFQEGFRGTDSLGRNRNQPPRPFYEIPDVGVSLLDQHLTNHLARLL
jgi:hypothetical protein